MRVFPLLATLVIAAVSLTALAEPSPETMKLVEQGSSFYLHHDFKHAIGPYARALELEKKNPTLDKTLWFVLIDNLGMAYGISGDLAKAKETFDYGITKAPDYPLFYYNLACTYAEMNDLDATIANLRQAFKNKAHIIPGEQMPDPSQDDSFQRFMKNERFVKTLRELE